MDEKAKRISDTLEEKLKEKNFIEERLGTDVNYVDFEISILYTYGTNKDQNKIIETIRDILLDIIPAAQTYDWGERTFTLHLKSDKLFSENTTQVIKNFMGSMSPAEPEQYEPIIIPIDIIKEMMLNGQWENSMEQEEVKYNIDNNLYTDQEYVNAVKELNCI